MNKNKLTKDKKEELFELYKTFQYTYKQLAERFNVSVSSVACMLNRQGLKGKRENNHYRKYEINQNYFDYIDSEEKAYFLGFLYADGCNHFNNTKITMFLKEEDKDILIKLNNLLQPTKPLIYCIKKDGSNQYGLQISNKKISERLSELGCIPKKTFILNFPNEEQVPFSLLNHFVRGYFDGDGWLGVKDISISSSNIFCDTLSQILKNKFNIKTKGRRKNKITELIFSRYDIKKFLDWIYTDSTICLDRKYQRYLKYYFAS